MTRLQEVCVCAYTLLVCALGRAADILSLPRCCCAATANAMLLLLLVAAAAAVHIKPLLQTLACYCCNDRLALQVRPPPISLYLSRMLTPKLHYWDGYTQKMGATSKVIPDAESWSFPLATHMRSNKSW